MKSLKLKLVQQIMATNDPEVLETIRQILAASESSAPTDNSVELPPRDPLAQALGLGRTESDPDLDTQDLQQSIDDIFNPTG